MSGFQVGVAALTGPARRLKQISVDLAMAASGAATAAGNAGTAAGDPAVTSAAEVFKAGVQSALGALAEDAGLLGDKVQQAGATYGVVDQNAMPAAGQAAPTPAAPTAPVPAAPTPAAPTAPMACGTGGP